MAMMTESEIGSLVVSLEQKNKAIERLELSLASALNLVEIRDRKIELQDKEIEFLKKLLTCASISITPNEPVYLEPGQPVYEPHYVVPIARDRADLETDEYPKYDEFMEKKGG
jgi:hypothetical protein